MFHVENWPLSTIATQLGVHHTVVKRVLLEGGISRDKLVISRSMSDPFIPFIQDTLKMYPKLTATRLYEMVKARGYAGGIDHFRDIVAQYRPHNFEAFARLRTLPGEQAQVDWAHFGKIKIGKAERRLLGFVMVLSWSRMIFLRFFFGGDGMANFLRGHVYAFAHWNLSPRTILYDNLKSAVVEGIPMGSNIHDDGAQEQNEVHEQAKASAGHDLSEMLMHYLLAEKQYDQAAALVSGMEGVFICHLEQDHLWTSPIYLDPTVFSRTCATRTIYHRGDTRVRFSRPSIK